MITGLARQLMSQRIKNINKSNEAIKHLVGRDLTSDECEDIFNEILGNMIAE